jgi:hypothetical protein
MPAFNEEVYEAAIRTLAQQVVAMVREDCGDDWDDFTVADYLADTITELSTATRNEVEKEAN